MASRRKTIKGKLMAAKKKCKRKARKCEYEVATEDLFFNPGGPVYSAGDLIVHQDGENSVGMTQDEFDLEWEDE